MPPLFDRITIAVPDITAAVEETNTLLGTRAFSTETDQGEAVAWWGLPNTVLEIVQRPPGPPRIEGIVFSAANAGWTYGAVENSLGLNIARCDGERTAAFRREQPSAQCGAVKVDHLVLRTSDAQACVELFNARLGIRLALDKTVPEWGGRMLFFRAGKLTLEVIESDADGSADDFFWGIAYQCRDVALYSEELRGRGVALSEMREGRKPGTRVASIKSHSLSIPTLLIEPAT